MLAALVSFGAESSNAQSLAARPDQQQRGALPNSAKHAERIAAVAPSATSVASDVKPAQSCAGGPVTEFCEMFASCAEE